MKSFLPSIKRRLPISSRSFHAYEAFANSQSQAAAEMLAGMQAEIQGLREQLTHLEEAASQHRDEVRSLHERLEERQMLLYWQLYRRRDESLTDARYRFFSTLEPATGVNRLFQRAEHQLLREFDSLCTQHGITYWAIGGTLLGALRHGTMIPWDDDVDVAITRQDLERLTEAIENDPRYRITEVWDWYVLCKQIRFRTTDEANPAFVDLFVHDALTGDVTEAWHSQSRARCALESRLRERFSDSLWPQTPYLPPSHPLFGEIDSLLTGVQASLATDVSFTDSLEEATGFIYGIENIRENHSTGPYPVSDWIPVIRVPYDDFDIATLPSFDTYLTRLYGDYYRLPDDMNSHEHVAADYISNPDAVAAMKRFLGEASHLSSPEDEGTAPTA